MRQIVNEIEFSLTFDGHVVYDNNSNEIAILCSFLVDVKDHSEDYKIVTKYTP